MPELSGALYRAGSGEQVVLIHGFTGTWHHWRPVLAELVARYEVIAPTLAGHDGGPPFPADLDMSFSAATDSFERHLDELGVGRAHFVGNSLGGAIALELAKRGRARSVVAIAPAGGWLDGDPELRRLAKLFRRTVSAARISERLTKLILARPGTRRLAFRDAMRNGELVAPADALAMARATARCAVADAAIAALAQGHTQPLRELDQISCPVLIASPQFDRILPAELHAPRFRREIPRVEARTLIGCGHVPMWDDTAQVVSAICQFIERQSPNESPATATATNGYSQEPSATAPALGA